MRVLVIGGTGTVGRRVVRRLVEADAEPDVRVMTRDPEEVEDPAAGAEHVPGDLEDPGSLPGAFEGTEKVFLLTPLHPDEAELGLRAVEAAREAGVRHVVQLSVHRVEDCTEAPHFRSKVEITRGLEGSGLPYTVLKPNNFYQNDLLLREAIVEGGVYPQPIGTVGLSRVDAGDIARAAVAALTGSGHEGREYPIVGPDDLTGPETAEIWSDVLGREVEYGGDNLEAWARNAEGTLPDWMIEDFRIMYRHFQEHGLKASPRDRERQAELLDGEPRSFRDFAEETAAGWGEG